MRAEQRFARAMQPLQLGNLLLHPLWRDRVCIFINLLLQQDAMYGAVLGHSLQQQRPTDGIVTLSTSGCFCKAHPLLRAAPDEPCVRPKFGDEEFRWDALSARHLLLLNAAYGECGNQIDFLA